MVALTPAYPSNVAMGNQGAVAVVVVVGGTVVATVASTVACMASALIKGLLCRPMEVFLCGPTGVTLGPMSASWKGVPHVDGYMGNSIHSACGSHFR